VLTNDASEGKKGARAVPLNKEFRAALVALKAIRNHGLYVSLGFAGASSHSGRLAFVARCAKKIVEAAASKYRCNI
jgi:hypothetical protein